MPELISVPFVNTLDSLDLCRGIANLFMAEDIEVVVSETTLSQWVSHYLAEGSGQEVLGICVGRKERIVGVSEEYSCIGSLENRRFQLEPGEELIIRAPGFELQPEFKTFIHDKRVLVAVNDLREGDSTKAIVLAVRSYGGKVVAVGGVHNHGCINATQLGVPKLEFLLSEAG